MARSAGMASRRFTTTEAAAGITTGIATGIATWIQACAAASSSDRHANVGSDETKAQRPAKFDVCNCEMVKRRHLFSDDKSERNMQHLYSCIALSMSCSAFVGQRTKHWTTCTKTC